MNVLVFALLLLVLTPFVAGCGGEGRDAGQAAKSEHDFDGAVTDASLMSLKGGDPSGTTTTKGTGYISYFTGSTANVSPTTQPALLLVGGGTDRDDAMQWFVDRSGRGDMVILRASGADGYNTWLVEKGSDSVESIVFSSRTAASDPAITAKLRQAEAIFFAGGDQSEYVKYWKDTPVATEVNAAAARGVPVGGTSAGLAILGQFLYSAMGKSMDSAVALANPYHRDITLDKDFLAFPSFSGLITDSHFVTRDRMGRLLTFMARLIKEGWAPSVLAFGVDDTVAVGINEVGVGVVFADTGKAYALSSTTAPTVCVASKPLTFAAVNAYSLGKGATFNFGTWAGASGDAYQLSVTNGVVSSSKGSIY